MNTGDKLQDLLDTIGLPDGAPPDYSFSKDSLDFSPKALSALLRWAALNPYKAADLARRLAAS